MTLHHQYYRRADRILFMRASICVSIICMCACVCAWVFMFVSVGGKNRVERKDDVKGCLCLAKLLWRCYQPFQKFAHFKWSYQTWSQADVSSNKCLYEDCICSSNSNSPSSVDDQLPTCLIQMSVTDCASKAESCRWQTNAIFFFFFSVTRLRYVQVCQYGCARDCVVTVVCSRARED